MLEPTEIKNNPSRMPLKGSIVVSNSCLYSLSAKTTPAKKLPRAGDNPTSTIAKEIPTTNNNAVAVNTSLNPVSAIYRKIYLEINLPAIIIPLTKAIINNNCNHPGTDETLAICPPSGFNEVFSVFNGFQAARIGMIAKIGSPKYPETIKLKMPICLPGF